MTYNLITNGVWPVMELSSWATYSSSDYQAPNRLILALRMVIILTVDLCGSTVERSVSREIIGSIITQVAQGVKEAALVWKLCQRKPWGTYIIRINIYIWQYCICILLDIYKMGDLTKKVISKIYSSHVFNWAFVWCNWHSKQ